MQTHDSQQSHTLQRRFIKIVNENLAPGIDEVLSAYFPGDEIIRINKIEIDLGTITNESLEKDFAAKCLEGFANKIKAMPVKRKLSEVNEANIMEKKENTIEQFFYFLSSGKMLWAAYAINFQQWQTAISEAIKTKTDFFKKEFTDLLIKYPQAIERLVLQFDDEFTGGLIELYHPSLKKEYEFFTQVLKKQIFPAGNYFIRKQVLVRVLSALLGTEKRVEKKQVQDMLNRATAGFPKEVNEQILLMLEKAIVSIVEKSGTVFSEMPLVESVAEKPVESNVVKEIKTKTKEEIKDNRAGDKSIFINNAGIIILHPFLQNIFKTIGLMEAENFKDDLSKQRAVHLLQYMANGEKEAPEYIMYLNKILCGMEEGEHIDRFIQLEESEIKEADELLKAVIAHWAILKNTSPEAMQETFFQRNGKLTFNETDGYWKLQVERKAVDVLLDKLPWGISYIQLPWMKHRLVTEWQ